jgi:hypothetical protein
MTSGLGSSDGTHIETSMVNVISLNLHWHEQPEIAFEEIQPSESR